VARQLVFRACFCLIAGLVAASSLPAHAIVISIDHFSVTRNGTPFFIDNFDDGLEPPSGPSIPPGGPTNPAAYTVQGTIPNTAEAGGLLQLNSANGVPSANANGDPRLALNVRLVSNIDPTNLTQGLKSNFAMSLTGIFTLPAGSGPAGSEYAIRFNDASGGLGAHQVLQLQVRFNASNAPEIRYALQDFDAGTITTLGSTPFAPPPGTERIFLNIDRSTATSDFFASFDYMTSGLLSLGHVAFATPGQMFVGENFVRAEFHVSEAIPEPATLAVLLIGLAGVAVLRARRLRLATCFAGSFSSPGSRFRCTRSRRPAA